MTSVLHLSDELQTLAEQNLDETDTRREEGTADLRAWINEDSDVPNMTDPIFSLAFLRASKFDQNEARERVRRYWFSRRQAIMQHMNDLDPESPDVLDILRGQHAVYIPLPGYDRDGRRVILARWDELDVTGCSYTFDQWFRAITLVFDTVCFLDPRALINGITFLMDAKGVAMKHFLFFGWENCRNQFAVMQKGYPIRIKQVHYINNNAVISLFLRAVKAVLSRKLSNRIHLHGCQYNSVFDYIDMTNFPDDYLPDNTQRVRGSSQDIMERFIQDEVLAPTNLKFLKSLYKTDLVKVKDEVVANLANEIDVLDID